MSVTIAVKARVPRQLAGVTISKDGRLFVNFPRWVDVPKPSVAEVRPDGSLAAYPSEAMNAWDLAPGRSAAACFVCVQSVVADANGKLWALDPASPQFQGVVPGGPKLVKIDLATADVERVYAFDDAAAPPKSYLNDVRFASGHAFMSDSGIGTIVVLDLGTGEVRRLLEDHVSTKAQPDLVPVIGGRPFRFSADNTVPQVHSDGIAIDPGGVHLYYKALTATKLWRIPVQALLDKSLSSQALGNQAEAVAEIGPTDGLEFDAAGNLYFTALEADAIKVLRPDGTVETWAASPDFAWPDTITIASDGALLFSASQFHRMPAFNENSDHRSPPYCVFEVR
jgi:sugar lactone lactonase YvrE